MDNAPVRRRKVTLTITAEAEFVGDEYASQALALGVIQVAATRQVTDGVLDKAPFHKRTVLIDRAFQDPPIAVVVQVAAKTEDL
jgi:hypothetical protein